MNRRDAVLATIILMTALVCRTNGSELRYGQVKTTLVPGPVEFAALLPNGYAAGGKSFPLLILLHGGNGSCHELANQRPLFDELWNEGRLPGVVVVMPSAGRSLYMDYRDGSQQWERFIMGPFLDHVRRHFHVAADRNGTLIAGASMGGLGALRLAFKYPESFAAVAAFEPGILPALRWSEVQPRHRFFRSDEFIRQIYGDPVDSEFWMANNPAAIAKQNGSRLRKLGLQIYLECGDEDYLNLQDGTEFLHRLLWDNGIKHEYHSVRGADHLGRTLAPRFKEGYGFFQRVLNPPGPDPAIDPLKQAFGAAKQKAESGIPIEN